MALTVENLLVNSSYISLEFTTIASATKAMDCFWNTSSFFASKYLLIYLNACISTYERSPCVRSQTTRSLAVLLTFERSPSVRAACSRPACVQAACTLSLDVQAFLLRTNVPLATLTFLSWYERTARAPLARARTARATLALATLELPSG